MDELSHLISSQLILFLVLLCSVAGYNIRGILVAIVAYLVEVFAGLVHGRALYDDAPATLAHTLEHCCETEPEKNGNNDLALAGVEHVG